MERARADAKLSELSQKRLQDLVTKNLESKQRLDEANAQLDASNAVVAETQARLASLEVELDKSVLTAPFDGQIIAQYLDPGAVISVGQNVFRIIDNSALEARFGLPEDTAFLLQSAISFRLQVNAQEVKADLKTIERSRNRATRTLDAIFSISPDNRNIGNVVTGDIVSLTVELPYQQQGAWLPLSALSNGVRGMWSVLVFDPETSELSSRLVIAEHVEEQAVYVSGGLLQDDLVVVDGLQRFTQGQKVLNYTKLAPTDVFVKR
ncbi:MAG: efflux RND transporter periplasmic adaptor subunit [Pseudomonadota bacterium]